MDIRATVNIQTQWTQSEINPSNINNVTSDEGELKYQMTYTSGTGNRQINCIYHDISVLPALSGLRNYDLTSMTGLTFGLNSVKSFQYVKCLTIKNISTGTNAILSMILTEADSFNQCFGNPIETLRLYPSGIDHRNVLGSEFPVSINEKNIRLENTSSSPCQYELTIFGIE